MKKNIYNLVFIFLGISLTAYSQQFTGKIYPTDPSLTYQFGYAEYEGICLDEKTLIVSDYRGRKTTNSACQYDQGNVNIYKKNGNNAWEISQVLTSDSNIHFFGAELALNKNMLVVLGGPEIYTQSAVYIYTRANIDSEFKLKTTLFGPEPSKRSYYYHSIAVNDNYLVANASFDYGTIVYKIIGDEIIPHKTFLPDGQYALDLELTDNNVLVAIYNDRIEHFKIKEDTIIRTYSRFSDGKNWYTHIAVDGNTVVHELANYPDNLTTNYAFMKIDANGNHFKSADTIKISNTDGADIAIKEDSVFFNTTYRAGGTSRYPLKTDFHVYSAGQYKYFGTVTPPVNSTGEFGIFLAYSHNILAVGDFKDSSQVYNGPKACNGKKGKGAVSLFSTRRNTVITGFGDNVTDTRFSSLVSPNPYNNGELHVSLPKAAYVEIINFNGVTIRKEAVVNNSISLSGLTKGVYMVKVSSTDEIRTERLIVE